MLIQVPNYTLQKSSFSLFRIRNLKPSVHVTVFFTSLSAFYLPGLPAFLSVSLTNPNISHSELAPCLVRHATKKILHYARVDSESQSTLNNAYCHEDQFEQDTEARFADFTFSARLGIIEFSPAIEFWRASNNQSASVHGSL